MSVLLEKIIPIKLEIAQSGTQYFLGFTFDRSADLFVNKLFQL